jgi:hypothetical protein
MPFFAVISKLQSRAAPSKRPNEGVTLVTGRVVCLALTRPAAVSCYWLQLDALALATSFLMRPSLRRMLLPSDADSIPEAIRIASLG